MLSRDVVGDGLAEKKHALLDASPVAVRETTWSFSTTMYLFGIAFATRLNFADDACEACEGIEVR